MFKKNSNEAGNVREGEIFFANFLGWEIGFDQWL